ncbi:hypothetical protein LCGC14_1046230 [marine sediment metagenome]|uniref:Glycosyl transferase family 1 domain-containing protein n=1 Tax=marine sediment metagenome TaxID=412755 RepID=A0A0F9NC05_9ZZZZ
MYILYCHPSYDRKGGTLRPIARLLSHFYDVELRLYKGEKRGAYLGHNTLDHRVISKKMRRVVFVGGARPGDHGIPRKWKWNKVDHVVFISHFFRNIAKSRYKIRRSSVIHLIGGTPSDEKMVPVKPFVKSFNEIDEINFMICAKWNKRYFKRYMRHINLFNDIIQECYPNSKLHVLGKKITGEKAESGNIILYRKDFHGSTSFDVYNKSDIQLILTPFDTGPMTVNESMHYRVPFICGNNSAAQEFIDMVDGVCGDVVKIDPQIRTAKHCNKYQPMVNKKFYGRKLNDDLIMKSVHNIVKNYAKYVSWRWTDEFNYEVQAKKWMNILFG